MLAPAAPRWPSVRPRRGHYESYYVRAVDPAGPRGIWIRYTIAVSPAGRPTARLWCTFFDRPLPPAPSGARNARSAPATAHSSGWTTARSPTARSPDRCRRRPAAPAGNCGTGTEAPLLHLPRQVYGTRLPRTKLLSLSPSAVFEGWVEVEGESIAVAGWPGMVGHNWGEEHAPAWMWLHGVDVTGAGTGTWLDVALARIRIGRVLTPWSAFGAMSLGGRRLRLGGAGRRVVVREEPARCQVRISGRGLRLTADVSAPADAFVSWDYPNPSGPPRAVVNCLVADLSLRVERPRQPQAEWTAAARAVYERGRSTAGPP